MLELPESNTSYWEESTPDSKYPALTNNLHVDVAIIGGGIAGLTAAYLLKQAGKTVAVIEKNTIGGGVSNNTTGKVTSQHNNIYTELYETAGLKHARNYGMANQAALAQIKRIILDEKIVCDWQQDDNYVYTTNIKEVNMFRIEAGIAQKLGLPASFISSSPLPLDIKAAVRFSDQARFNIKKYLIGLAKAIDGDRSYVFEHTRAKPAGVRDSSPAVVKTNGGTVTAKDIVIATNVPFTAGARGSYCMLEYPQKSYIVAGRPAKAVQGMYISPDEGHYSIMPMNRIKDGQLLLIGGEGHIPGIRGNANTSYQRLADYGAKHFGMKAIDYKWSARDYLSCDNIPLVGKLYPWSKHVYVTTAFMKWGLTNTTVSAMILRDVITRQKNPWADTFNSNRLEPVKSIPRVFASYVGLR